MIVKSISLTKQNDEWLKNQISESKFNDKSEAINYLIEQERRQKANYDFVRVKIKKGEQSGFAKNNHEKKC